MLAITNRILDVDGCVVTDQNAASSTVRFYDAGTGIEIIDFNRVFADSWIHENAYETAMHKKIKCAEILVPEKVAPDYIIGAYVVNEAAKIQLVKNGFDKKIAVKSAAFFW